MAACIAMVRVATVGVGAVRTVAVVAVVDQGDGKESLVVEVHREVLVHIVGAVVVVECTCGVVAGRAVGDMAVQLSMVVAVACTRESRGT